MACAYRIAGPQATFLTHSCTIEGEQTPEALEKIACNNNFEIALADCWCGIDPKQWAARQAGGRAFSANTALRIGLITEIIDDAELELLLPEASAVSADDYIELPEYYEGTMADGRLLQAQLDANIIAGLLYGMKRHQSGCFGLPSGYLETLRSVWNPNREEPEE